MSWNIRVRADGVDCGRFLRSIYLAVAALFTILAFAQIAFPVDGITVGVSVTFAACLIVGIMALRTAVSGVRLSPEGVLVRNPLRTHPIRWPDFVEFDVRRWGIHPSMGSLLRRRARPIHVFTLASWGPFEHHWDDAAVSDAVSDLNRMAMRLRIETAAPGRDLDP